MTTTQSSFSKDFLDNYLKFGLGSMPRADIDALVMHLLDRYGYDECPPMAPLSNQIVSEHLRTPVAKVKKLRYEAALKFGGPVEDQAKGRLLSALAISTLEPEQEKICLVIEDTLAKNWLQGQLKLHQQIFDHSFNTEIVKVSASSLFMVLEDLFDNEQLETFKKNYEEVKREENTTQCISLFKKLARNFAEGAAKAAGGGVIEVLKARLPLP